MKSGLLGKLHLSRGQKRLLWATGLVVLYTVAGFLLLPPIIRVVAVKQLRTQLHRDITIEKVRLNPYALSLTIRGLKVKDPDAETLFAWDEVYVNLQMASFFGHPWVFDEISVINPYARIVVNKDYTLNISDILAAHSVTNAAPKPAAPSRPPSLHVHRFRIEGARLSATDLTPRKVFHRVIGPVRIALTDLHTDPASRNPHLFTGSTDTGETFSWNGQFSLEPIQASGELSVEHIALNRLAPLYEDFVNFEIRDGLAALHVEYRFEQAQAGIVAAISNASFGLRSFKLGVPGTENNLVEVPELSVSGVSGDVRSHHVEVGTVLVRGADLQVVRDKGAAFNFVQAAQVNTNQSAAGAILMLLSSLTNVVSKSLSSTNFVTGTVRAAEAQDCSVTVRDTSPDRPVILRLDQINASARNLSNRPDTNILAEVALRWNTNGTIKGKLDASLTPLKADLDLQLNQVELAPLSPYLDSFVNLYVLGSKLGLEGAVQLRTEAAGPPSVTYVGSASLDELNLVGSETSEDFLKWAALRFDGMSADLNPAAVTITNVTLKGLAVLIVMETNHTLNVMSLLRTNLAGGVAAAVVAPATSESSGAPGGSAIKRAFAQVKTLLGMETNNLAAGLPKVMIDAISIENGTLQLLDRSVTPTAQMSFQKIQGTIKDISTEEVRRAQVNLEMLAGGTGPIEVTGQLNPLWAKQATEAKLTVKNFRLNPVDPYAGKYLGYRLNRGELNLDMDYTVSASQVKGRNLVTLDQLTLGDKVASPDATHMPVKLAIALLKDIHGKIEIDVPVEGNLDDPQFQLGKVIWHVIGNVFVKAVTSPFALLGSLVAGGKAGEEMQFQEFPPGSAELDTVARDKLANLAKALEARPGLQVAIEGNVQPNLDTQALRRAKLESDLRAAYWQSLRASAREKTPVSDVVLAPEKRADLLERAFREFVRTNAMAAAQTGSTSAVPAELVAVMLHSTTATSEEKGASRLLPDNPPAASRPPVASTPGGQTGTTSAAILASGTKPTPDQMAQVLAEQLSITDAELAALAAERARQVQTNLVQELHIATDRVLLSDPPATGYATNGHRVTLQLQ